MKSKLQAAVAGGELRESSMENILRLTGEGSSELVRRSVSELIERGEWTELDDRFFRALVFGTGGLRGRSIGKIVTEAERGTPSPLGRPEHPCAGTNAMNDYNIRRATRGLVAYLKDWMRAEGLRGRPRIVIAHDTRHFSKELAGLVARVAAESGADASLFDGPRSTPELSFAVRHLGAQAGVVITASHNPPHDNGLKAYFADGAQVVEPHASGIIGKVDAGNHSGPPPEGERGSVEALGREIDDAYLARLLTLVLDPKMVEARKEDLSIVFTPIHGTGGIMVERAFERLGINYRTVPEQDAMDGRFPTVSSPNPENAEALAMAIDLAKKEGADLVMGTDPDSDRMGAAVRSADGEMVLLSGNQIGSLMAWYRVKTLFDQGILNAGNASRAVIIKTLVTSDLQKAIAEKAGLRCVETLTGFKYIGEKLGKYEDALPDEALEGYRQKSEAETRRARLEHSSFYVFGGEESYGYSGADFVRDKDANGAVVMFAEVAAYAKSQGRTLDQLLDDIFAEHGYYTEKNGAMTFEGAEGAAKIQRLMDSYLAEPPRSMDGSPVESARNFVTEDIRDVEGDLLPKERMLIFSLADGRRVAVRPSGTEPKIKFYLFARKLPEGQRFAPEELAETKQRVDIAIDGLWDWMQEDVKSRAQ